MSKATNFSVTKIRCTCGYLKRAAQQPNFPIKFDADLNEYSFESTLPAGTKLSLDIHHCPMCGGVASDSKRHRLFTVVSVTEVGRLKAIIGKIKTVEDIERTLGPADDEISQPPLPDFVQIQPRSGKPETKSIRAMNFTRLSDTADVQFIVYSNGEIESSIAGKYLGAPARAPGSTPKRPRRSSRSRLR